MNIFKRLFGKRGIVIQMSKPAKGRTYSTTSGKYFVWGFMDEELHGKRTIIKWDDYRCKAEDFNRGDQVMYCPKDQQDMPFREECFPGMILDLTSTIDPDKVLVRFGGTDLLGHTTNERYVDPGDLKLRI